MRLTGSAAAVRGSQIKLTCTVSGVAGDTYPTNTSPGVRWQIGDSTVEEGLWEEGSQYTSIKEVVQLLPHLTAARISHFMTSTNGLTQLNIYLKNMLCAHRLK